MRKAWVGVLLAASLLAGCSTPADGANGRVELIVSAAASLTDAMTELETRYEAANPDVSLLMNFGSSGSLQRQIEQGAQADLFVSAGTKQMEALVEQGLVETDLLSTLLLNELVVVVPADAGASPESPDDLASSAIGTIAVGETETVPAGGYAKETLRFYGLWDELQPKLVFAKDVRQVLAYVETGNADAGIVYGTDAAASEAVAVAFAVDADSHAPIAYPAAVVSATEHPEEARAFFAYLQDEEARAVFESYGFLVPAPP